VAVAKKDGLQDKKITKRISAQGNQSHLDDAPAPFCFDKNTAR